MDYVRRNMTVCECWVKTLVSCINMKIKENKMRIAIGNDHAAVELKKVIKEYVESMGHEVVNFGTDTTESCSYPEYGEKVGRAVASGEFDCGILICGTGVGISIAANKVNGVRAAVCSDTATARLVKQHNNANIIAFGQDYMSLEDVIKRVKVFLNTDFLGSYNLDRVKQIELMENKDD